MAENTQLAILKKDVIDVVAGRINYFISKGELHLPADYSPDNAMKSAWLILQEAVDRDRKPVLQTCSKESIANSLLDMVIQGLNPSKKQGYFIAFGNKLTWLRSYFGTIAVTKQVRSDIQDIIPEVVYEGDTFKYKIVRGKKEITEHEQALENIDGKKIKAAYCLVINYDGEVVKTEIMTIEEIKQAWKQSQLHPVDEKGQIKAGTTHDKFTADMCKKTVVNRCCKPIINSSNDSHLFRESINRTSEIVTDAEVEEEIAANANSEVIDISPMEELPENIDTPVANFSIEQPEKDKAPMATHAGAQPQFDQGPGF